MGKEVTDMLKLGLKKMVREMGDDYNVFAVNRDENGVLPGERDWAGLLNCLAAMSGDDEFIEIFDKQLEEENIPIKKVNNPYRD